MTVVRSTNVAYWKTFKSMFKEPLFSNYILKERRNHNVSLCSTADTTVVISYHRDPWDTWDTFKSMVRGVPILKLDHKGVSKTTTMIKPWFGHCKELDHFTFSITGTQRFVKLAFSTVDINEFIDFLFCFVGRYSEKSKTKCIGITIETRPDYCLKRHLKWVAVHISFGIYKAITSYGSYLLYFTSKSARCHELRVFFTTIASRTSKI